MKPSTDTTLCMITLPTGPPRHLLAGSPQSFRAGGIWACKKSIGRHRAHVLRTFPLCGEPAPQGQVLRRSVTGEAFELPAEVGMVEVARRLGEFRPVDRAQGIHGHDQPCK